MTLTEASSVRQFQSEDLPQVTRINQTCLPENYPDSFFLMIFSSFPEGFLLAELDGEIVGYTMNRIEIGSPSVSSHKWPLKRIKKGHVISIAVFPYARRNGIGQLLMKEAIDKMVKQGAEECFLEVRVSNNPAITMYENLGFSRVKTLKRYYSDNEDAFLMSRSIV